MNDDRMNASEHKNLLLIVESYLQNKRVCAHTFLVLHHEFLCITASIFSFSLENDESIYASMPASTFEIEIAWKDGERKMAWHSASVQMS
jgi:hypothetical protein